jgi:SAM-dependent methyltransferase
MRFSHRWLWVAVVLPLAAAPAVVVADDAQVPRTPDVVFVPTPDAVVDAMLEMAKVGPKDVVYDLGCGDGRLVVGAALRGARRAIGVDIDPERVKEARARAKSAGVEDKVEIVEGDLFEMDFADATVVTLYLLPSLNMRLRPKILSLKPGTRIVSHDFDMGDWEPEQVRHVAGKTVYYWTVPKRSSSARATSAAPSKTPR